MKFSILLGLLTFSLLISGNVAADTFSSVCSCPGFKPGYTVTVAGWGNSRGRARYSAARKCYTPLRRCDVVKTKSNSGEYSAECRCRSFRRSGRGGATASGWGSSVGSALNRASKECSFGLMPGTCKVYNEDGKKVYSR